MNDILRGRLVELLGDQDKFLLARFDITALNGSAELANLGSQRGLGGTIAETAVDALAKTLLGTQ